MSSPRKEDLSFQIPALIIVTALSYVSFRNLDYPFYSIQSPMNNAGVVMFIISLIIRISAHLTLSTNYSWTLEIREGYKLVENGLYKYVRHPIYLGTIIGAIAVPVYTSSFMGFLIGLLSIPLFDYRISIEERMLITEFGDEFIHYQERTWKLIPFLF